MNRTYHKGTHGLPFTHIFSQNKTYIKQLVNALVNALTISAIDLATKRAQKDTS